MTLNYVCRKCGKVYSETEFQSSSYCTECGVYLLRKFSVTPPEIESAPKASGKQQTVTVPQPKEAADLSRVAENLRKRSQTTKEYEVLPTAESKKPAEGLGADGWIFSSDYDLALRLKADLLKKFESVKLEDAIAGKAVSNEHGECYCVQERHDVLFEPAGFEESRRVLLSDLKILPGIGPAREKDLKTQGYKTIEDLAGNLKWRKPAKDYLKLVESKNVLGLQDRLRRCLPKSHPLSHYLAGFCRSEDFAIIDIETLGLFGRPIILVGEANVEDGHVVTRQFLVRDVSEEAAALWEFTSKLGVDCAFVSFNGRCFDVPFIRERLAYYGLGADEVFGNLHFDVLHFTRRAFRDRLSNCRLETVEKHLGIKRSINIPGALVPEFYDSYQRSGNVGPLVAIVEHNKQDLVTLAQLFCSLYREWNL